MQVFHPCWPRMATSKVNGKPKIISGFPRMTEKQSGMIQKQDMRLLGIQHEGATEVFLCEQRFAEERQVRICWGTVGVLLFAKKL